MTAEAYTKPSIKNAWTPDIPWKPQCGENQQRRGFIGSCEMIYSSKNTPKKYLT
jgi:hypothetical protein